MVKRPPWSALAWQPREPPLIVVDDYFVLDRWRQAAAMPDSHYDGDERMRGNLRAWREGRRLNWAIRRGPDGEAVGWVELRRAGEQAAVSCNVTAELRGRGIAPRALSALLTWAASQIGLRRAHLACHVDIAASRRVAESAGSSLLAKTATSTSSNGTSLE